MSGWSWEFPGKVCLEEDESLGLASQGFSQWVLGWSLGLSFVTRSPGCSTEHRWRSSGEKSPAVEGAVGDVEVGLVGLGPERSKC